MQYFTPDTPYATLGFLSVLIVAAVVHEMGHLLIARLLGIPIRRISIGLGPVVWHRQMGAEREFVLRLFPLSMTVGVPARLRRDGTVRRSIRQDLFLAAGGPAASLLLFLGLAAAAGLGHPSPEILSWLQATAVLSAFLGLCNLVPLPGLDGGHMLILCAAGAGLQLSCQKELMLHRVGLRLLAAASVVVVVARLTSLI